MAGSQAKKLAALILILVALALIVNTIAGLVGRDEWAFDAAEAACRERGLQLGEVSASKSKISGNLIGKTAEIQFKGKRQNRPTAIHVTLRKPLHFLGWQVVDVQEEPAD